jgi:hypothetical protein
LLACSQSQFSDRAVGQVVHLSNKFARNTDDVAWIQALAAEKRWTILSGDAFRKRNGVERKVIRQSGLSVFVLQPSWSSYQYWEKTAQLVRWWPRIVEQANLADGIAMEVPWRTAGKFKQL